MSVDHPAGALHQLHVLDLAYVVRALEHEVLEEVREPRTPFRLGPEPHVVDDGDPDERAGVVGRHEHPEPVVEGGALEVGESLQPSLSGRNGHGEHRSRSPNLRIGAMKGESSAIGPSGFPVGVRCGRERHFGAVGARSVMRQRTAAGSRLRKPLSKPPSSIRDDELRRG